jgi:hypothetical protein
VSTTPNPWNIPFPGNPHFSVGHNPQAPQQPLSPQGTHLYYPYGKMPNPAYNPQNPSGYPPLTHFSRTTSNPVYPGQHQPYTRGPTGYNYPPNPVYGPIGVPMPHQYYP